MFKSQSYYDNTKICSIIKLSDNYVDHFIKNGLQNINITIVLDISESMNKRIKYSSDSKIKVAIISILKLLEFLISLKEQHNNVIFSLILFNHDTHVICNNFEFDDNNIFNGILDKIKNIEASGGTNFKKILTLINSLNSFNPFDPSNSNNSNNSDKCIFFITDGYDNNNNNFNGKNYNLNNNLTNYQMLSHSNDSKKFYYGIGLGIIGDYDDVMMCNLFGNNFYGCPLSQDIYNFIISTIMINTPKILKHIKFKFDKNITSKYNINIINTTLDIIVSSKIIICLELKNQSLNHDFTEDSFDNISVNLSGMSHDASPKSIYINLNANCEYYEKCNEFTKYFEYFDFYKNMLSSNFDFYKNVLSSNFFNIDKKKIQNITNDINIFINQNKLIDNPLMPFYVEINKIFNSFLIEFENINDNSLIKLKSYKINSLNTQFNFTESNNLINKIKKQSNNMKKEEEKTDELKEDETNELKEDETDQLKDDSNKITKKRKFNDDNDNENNNDNDNDTKTPNSKSRKIISNVIKKPRSNVIRTTRSSIYIEDMTNEYIEDMTNKYLNDINNYQSNENTDVIMCDTKLKRTKKIKETTGTKEFLEVIKNYQKNEFNNIVMCKICDIEPCNMLFGECEHVYSCDKCITDNQKCLYCNKEIHKSIKLKHNIKKICIECNNKNVDIVNFPCNHAEYCKRCSYDDNNCKVCNFRIINKLEI
jgi:hypothetical protein